MDDMLKEDSHAEFSAKLCQSQLIAGLNGCYEDAGQGHCHLPQYQHWCWLNHHLRWGSSSHLILTSSGLSIG